MIILDCILLLSFNFSFQNEIILKWSRYTNVTLKLDKILRNSVTNPLPIGKIFVQLDVRLI